MSRVAQLDTQELDNEVHVLIWKDFQSHIQPARLKEELKLLVDSLVFYFGSTNLKQSCSTVTYSSGLSGVSFQCRKRTLFLVNILANYLQTKFSHLIFNSNSQWAFKLYTIISHIYVHLDLLNALHFLVSASPDAATYLSPLHRLLGVASVTTTNDPKNFYQNTVYAGIEFQNRQLLWNAILELFNMTLLNNATWLMAKPKPIQNKWVQKDTVSCTHCGEFPVNPYTMACCDSVYCYVCAVTALEWSRCDKCNKKNNLSATPFY